MLTKKELENYSTTELAVMCSKIADDPEHYTQVGADQAWELKREWASLQTAPEPSLNDERNKQAQLSRLHKRMAEFIVGIQP
jgi:hypothetical protein